MIALNALLKEIERLKSESPPFNFAVAVLNDFLIDCAIRPLPPDRWQILAQTPYLTEKELNLLKARGFSGPFTSEQISFLAQVIKQTSLAETAIKYYKSSEEPLPESEITFQRFFAGVRGLPVDQIIKSAVRREEFVRQFLQTLQIPILGESNKQSQNELAKIDFIKMLLEAERADAALKVELANRERLMKQLQREARERDSSRGSYE